MSTAGHQFLKAEVAANQKRLESCSNHQFRPITPGLFGTRYRCQSCLGEVDGLSAKWYEKGRNHGAEKGPSPVKLNV